MATDTSDGAESHGNPLMSLYMARHCGLALSIFAALTSTALAGGHHRTYVLVVPTTTTTTTTTVAADPDPAPAPATTTTRYIVRYVTRAAAADPAASAQAPASKAAATPAPKAADPDPTDANTTVVRYIIRDAAPAAAPTTTTTTTTTTPILVRAVPVRARVVRAVPVTTTTSPTYLLVQPKHHLFGGW
jgi:hypothetical protein